MKKGRIVLFSNYRVFRSGFREILQYYFGENFIIDDTDFQSPLNDDFVPDMIITELTTDKDFVDYLLRMQNKGAKIVLLVLNSNHLIYFQHLHVDGFLVKNMTTDTMIRALEGILYDDDVYVHPDIGYQFYKKLIANNYKLA